MKSRIRIWVSMFLAFILVGGVSLALDISFDGYYPILHCVMSGIIIPVIYALFAFSLIELKTNFEKSERVFFSSMLAICISATMRCINTAFVWNMPVTWWIYLIWISVGLLSALKFYNDLKKLN